MRGHHGNREDRLTVWENHQSVLSAYYSACASHPKMLKQYLFCLRVPQPPVSLTGLAQFFKQGICPAQIFKVINGRQRHIKLCVCKLFSAGNGGKILCCLRYAVDSSHMCHHDSRFNGAFSRQPVGLNQVVGVSSGGAHDVCAGIMAVIQVNLCFKLVICGTCKEIHAAIKCQELIPHLRHLLIGYIYEYIVISMSLCNGHQLGYRVLHSSCIHITQFNTALLCRLL